MKKIITMFLLFTIVSAGAQAQNKPAKTAEERAEKRLEIMNKELSLNPAQQAKIKELLVANEKAKDADKEKMEAIKTARKERQKAIQEQLKSILTPEQYAKVEKKHKEAKNKRKSQHREGEVKEQKKEVQELDDDELEGY